MHTERRRESRGAPRPLFLVAFALAACASGCTREPPSAVSAPEAPAPVAPAPTSAAVATAPASQAAQTNAATLPAPAPFEPARPRPGALTLGAAPVSVRRPIPPGHGSIYVVYEGMSADAPPGIVFYVYVDDAPTQRMDEAYHVGTINFFEYRRNRTASDDVTALVEPMAKAGRSEVVITFVPLDGPPAAGSHARINEVKLVRQ